MIQESCNSIPYSSVPNLPQLRAFASVAEASSISRGAADLARSQPAISQSIAKLEASFGVPLLYRRHMGMVLNEAGTIVYDRVRRFFSELRNAVSAIGTEHSWSETEVDGAMARLVHTGPRGSAGCKR